MATTTAPANSAFFIRHASSCSSLTRKRVASAVPRADGSAVETDAEPVDDAVDDREERRGETDNRDEHVVAALARQRIEECRHRVASGEAAGVRVVVDAAHRE